MIRISFSVNIDKPRWWTRLFLCKHEVVSVTENAYSRYATQTSYMYCLKCGRKAGELESTCKHQENQGGKCRYCLQRLSKFDCQHDWITWGCGSDTKVGFCSKCWDWDDEVEI